MNEEKIIKSAITKLFNEGKSEADAYKELSKTRSFCKISESSVSYWYEKIRLEEHNLNEKEPASSMKILTDEYLIELINKYPDFTQVKLAEIAGVTNATISNRINQLNSGDEVVSYCKKDNRKFTDEFLIELVNKNPSLNMTELAKLTGTSVSTIGRRLKKINSNGERVKYIKKKYRPEKFGESNSELTDEYMTNLINDNPKLNMYELAELAGVSRMTISNKIKQIKLSGKCINYIKKDTIKFTDDYLINLVEENPNFTLEELSRYAGTSQKTIINRINQINSNGVKLKYTSKKPETISQAKITDELLIQLISENPELNMKQLAKLAGTSQQTVSRRIKKINSSGDNVVYIYKGPQKGKPESNEKSKKKSVK
jgi:transcriptional antiterminator